MDNLEEAERESRRIIGSTPSMIPDLDAALRIDEDDLRRIILRVTAALVASCDYCLAVSDDPLDVAPITCIHSVKDGSCSRSRTRNVDIECCLACGGYKNEVSL